MGFRGVCHKDYGIKTDDYFSFFQIYNPKGLVKLSGSFLAKVLIEIFIAFINVKNAQNNF